MSAVALVVLWLVVAPAYIDKTVVEAFPLSTAPTANGTPIPDVDAGPATAPAGESDTPGLRPDVVGAGELRGINHRASGRVALYRAPDGRHVVGLEDIDIEPGPDYFVWIVPGSDRESPGDGARLDRLRGNKGTQYYEVPQDFAVPDDITVLVWCRAFGVPIANAALRPT